MHFSLPVTDIPPIPRPSLPPHNKVVNAQPVLDTAQLRDVTLNDGDLMRDLVAALLEDTSGQLKLLENAIREGDSRKCTRLAHYSKGACANLGAGRAATVLKQIETAAAAGQFHDCSQSLAALSRELDLLRSASLAL